MSTEEELKAYVAALWENEPPLSDREREVIREVLRGYSGR